jgi:tRNA(adenine34) deaminase
MMASIWSKVHRIVFGAGREDVHKMYFEARAVNTLDFVTKAYRDDVVVEGGVLRDQCVRLYFRPWDRVPLEEQGNIYYQLQLQTDPGSNAF